MNAKKIKMIRCPNCGAQYEEGLLHCPYCRSVDDYQDESEYLEDLSEIKDKLEDMPENVLREQKKAQTADAARDLRKIFKYVGIAAAVILLLIGAATFYDKVIEGNSDAQISERQKQEYLWKQENFPKLDEMYEKKDYDGILDLVRSTDNGGIFDWKHYPLVDGLQILEYIPAEIRTLELLESEGKAGSDQYEDTRVSLFRDELELLFFDHRTADAADVEIIREKSAEFLEDFENRFALTDAERKVLEKKARQDSGNFYLSECREFLKNR